MAASDFPYLSDLLPEIESKLDQPAGEPGHPTWEMPAEYAQAATQEQLAIFLRIQDVDRSYGITVADTSVVAANSRTVSLPSDVRFIRHVTEIDSSGSEMDSFKVSTWGDLGASTYRYIYRPELKQLYLTATPTSAATLRIVYGYYPKPVIHGRVRSAGASSLQLGEHETTETSRVNGQVPYLYTGTGAGQTGTISSYDGPTRTATMSASWSTTPDTTTYYTSRPDLPLNARDAFVYGVCARLVEKLDYESYRNFMIERERHLDHLKQATMTADRSEPLETRNDMSGIWSSLSA